MIAPHGEKMKTLKSSPLPSSVPAAHPFGLLHQTIVYILRVGSKQPANRKPGVMHNRNDLWWFLDLKVVQVKLEKLFFAILFVLYFCKYT